MSTTTEKPPIEPPKPDHHDEFTGAFGFFRRYQKLILYTAGIFALITFSITTSLSSWMRSLTNGPSGPLPTIEVMGKEVELQVEDQLVAGHLARNLRALPPAIMPEAFTSGETTDLVTRLAILRRASIAVGLDVSMAEVDAAIDWLVRTTNSARKGSETATQLALQRGMSSLAEYRTLVKEGLRVGNYMMLNCLGVDSGDALVMRRMLDDDASEKIGVRVATFDMKALAEQMKAKGDVKEDDIRKWMEDKKDDEKTRLEVFDSNHVSLLLGIARFADFDPEQWADELKELKFGDEEQKRLYKQEIDRFKDDKGKTKPLTDETVVAELRKIAQVDEVMNKLLAKVREQQQEVTKPLIEALQKDSMAEMEAKQRVEEAKKVLATAKAAADAAPADEALKKAAADAELAERDRDSEYQAMLNAKERSQAAFDEARKNFDFRTRFGDLTKDKKGFELREVGTPRQKSESGELTGGDLKNAKALEDLSAIDLGNWKLTALATALRNTGELGGVPARAQKGEFLLQVTDVLVRPMRPWDDIKANLETKYFEEQTKKIGDEKKKIFEDELLRLAKLSLPERMAEIEQKRQPEIDRKYGEWEKKVGEDLAKAAEMIGTLAEGTQARKAWDARKAVLDAELAAKDQTHKAFEEEVGKTLDDEMKTEAKKKYGEVIAPAAEAGGFTLQTLEPIRRDIRSEPLFDKRHDRTVVFLWSGLVNELKVGESTPISEDTVERRWQFAVCDRVEPLTIGDITRREFEQHKRNRGVLEVMDAVKQSFTIDALKARYAYKDAVGRQRVQ